jgi:subtilisin family serine protease
MKLFEKTWKFATAIVYLAAIASSWAHAEPTMIRVAVVDTGLDLKDPRFAGRICPGSKDFSGTGIEDTHGHGTHVAGTILRYAKMRKNFCLMILKFYDAKASGSENIDNTVRAFRYAAEQRVNVVNYSAGGPDANRDEREALASMPWATIVVAAGNDNRDTVAGRDPSSGSAGYFPAAYGLKNVIVVGALDTDGRKLPASNFGPGVRVWELGKLNGPLPGGREGIRQGTSQAAAVLTGKLLAGSALPDLVEMLKR